MTLSQALNHDPLFVGFDRILDRMHHINTHQQKTTNYPPYNIIKDGDDKYLVQVAIAGWKQEDIDITVEDGELKIEGIAPEKDADSEFLHKGIALRSFRRTFQLADTVVVNGASLEDGILSVQLENIIPEHKKPKKIEIQAPALEHDTKELLTEE